MSAVIALSIVALISVAGVGIDWRRMQAQRTSLQSQLDAAVLAAVRQDDEDLAHTQFNAFVSGLKGSNGTFNWTQGLTERVVSGTANSSLPTLFMGLFGYNTVALTVSAGAKVAMLPTSIELQAARGRGRHDKVVELWVQRSDGGKDVVARVSYQMTSRANGGTGTTTVWPSSVISIPAFTNLWIVMTVVAQQSGASAAISSRNASDMNHFFLNGVKQSTNSPASVEQLLPCGQKIEYALESSLDRETSDAWKEQDLLFNVTTSCRRPSPQPKLVH